MKLYSLFGLALLALTVGCGERTVVGTTDGAAGGDAGVVAGDAAVAPTDGAAPWQVDAIASGVPGADWPYPREGGDRLDIGKGRGSGRC
jgi:hypothetical protein